MDGEVVVVKLDADGLMFDDVFIRKEAVRQDGVRDGVVDEGQEACST